MSFLSADQIAAAASMIQEAHAEPPTAINETPLTPTSDTPTEPVAAEPAAKGEEAPPAETTPESATPKPEARKFKVKDGEAELEVDEDELLKGYERRANSTKKWMEAAELRKQAEAVIAKVKEREDALNGMLQNPTEVRRYLAYLEGGNPNATPQPKQQQPPPLPPALAQFDPNMPVTMGEVMQLLQHAQAQQPAITAETIEQRLAREREVINRQWMQMQMQQETAKVAGDIQGKLESAVRSAVEQYAILKGDDMEELTERLCDQAQKMEPATVEEAIKLIGELAAGRAERLTQAFTATRKAEVVAKANLETKGIEPPGVGSVVNVVPTPTHKLGTKEHMNAAAAELQRLLGQRR